jgi:hypothetical protein
MPLMLGRLRRWLIVMSISGLTCRAREALFEKRTRAVVRRFATMRIMMLA